MNMAEQNLTSIVDAKEKLKLEIAQNSVVTASWGYAIVYVYMLYI